MKVFFDTEFTGLRKDTTIISIGLVSDNYKKFYAEFTDYDKDQVDDWIKDNVINNLIINDENINNGIYFRGTKEEIAKELRKWFEEFDEEIELVSDVCHYDMVLLIDLFGSAFDLPKNVCPACYDINQDIAEYYRITQKEAFDKCREDIVYNNTSKDNKHNSLYDAMVIKDVYYYFNGYKK